jgi:hypothetical protein
MSLGVSIIGINVFVLSKSITAGALRKIQLLKERKDYRQE